MAKYVRRTPIRDIIGEEYTAAIGRYVAKLKVLGYNAIMEAYSDRGFNHRTRNLHDSYASAVYVNGELIEDTISYVGGEYSRGEDRQTGMTGRETVREYLENPDVDVSGTVTLLCVAAMEYAQYLEEGTHRGGYHIQVISAATDYVRRHWQEVEDEVFGIDSVRYIVAGNSEV